MDNKMLVLPAFILMALAQLYVPASMIMDREEVLATGTEYKFKTAPIDPNDPFRGKYITLDYADNTVTVPTEDGWTIGESVYVLLEKGPDGYARAVSVSKKKPDSDNGFVEAKVLYTTSDGRNELTVEYPFDRLYMEESKASEAESVYRETQVDSGQVAYALVSVLDGDAVLKDIYLDGVSIREIVKARQEANR